MPVNGQFKTFERLIYSMLLWPLIRGNIRFLPIVRVPSQENCMFFISRIQILVLLFFVCSFANAATLKDVDDARSLTDRVMAKVGEGDIESGIRMTKQFLIIPAAEFDVMLDQLKMQQPAMAQRFGKSIGYEFIREDKVGANLLRIIYVHRFEKHLMRWSFYFYRGESSKDHLRS